MPTRQQLESALINAHKAGDADAAKKLANAIKSGGFSEQQLDSGRGGGRSANARRIIQERGRIDSLRSQADAGQITSSELSEPEMADIQRARIAGIPEITGSFKSLSEDLGFMQALGGLTAFDPDEFGKILQSADPDIGIAMTPDGERIAVNRRTNDVMSINKLGPSLMDAIQVGGAAAMFSPAGAAKTIGGQALGGIVTQAAIESGQKALGGDFNPEDVAMAGAAPVVMSKATGIAKEAARSTREAFKNQAALQAKSQTKALSDDVGSLTSRMFKESSNKTAIRQALDEGTVESVGYKLNPKGKIVSAPLERDLIEQGIDEKVILRAKGMGAKDRSASKDMLVKTRKFIRGEKGSETDRPQKVIGNASMRRFRIIKKELSRAGKDLDNAVERELKGEPVNVSNAVEGFKNDLKKLRITFNDEGKLDLSDSILTGPSKPIRDAVRAIRDGVFDSADDLHRVKQSLDTNINYDSPLKDPIDSRAQDAMISLRKAVNKKLRSMSDSYAKANDNYAETAKVLKPFAKAMGKRFDPNNDRVENLVGRELRKTISNSQITDEMIEAVTNLDSMAKKLGGEFDEDIISLVNLNSELERVFGSFAPNSFQGGIEKGANIALERSGLAGEVAKETIEIAKNKLRFTPPSKEKLKLLNQLEQLISE